jgi:flavin reductase (DIM6/NTAB) family NADH-FMN oxidoreductase RutF
LNKKKEYDIMKKVNIGTRIFPIMPMSILGVKVDGKANFMALGWFNRVNANPPLLGVAVNKSHYSIAGIRENKTFSINIPNKKMMKETDYCGLASGKNTDKSEIFNVFYGKLLTAPMIDECPLCMECKLVETVEMPTNELFIGEIIETHIEPQYLTDDVPDMKKIDPLFLTMPDNNYWTLGENIGKAWSAGKELKK